MSRNQSQLITSTIRLSSALVLALAVIWSATAQAQTAPTPEWTQTGLTGPVKRLYTPASGALFACTNAGLVRSDDGGASWSDVAPPDLPRLHDVRFEIDGQTVFAATDAGVWRAPAP